MPGDSPLIYSCSRPTKVVSLNDNLNWHRLQTNKSEWLNAGFYIGAQIKSDLRKARRPIPLPRSRIQFDVDVADKRRRDGHNAVLCAKWFIDGLVLSKLFADDTTEHLELGDWTFNVVGRKVQPQLRVTITEAP